VGYELGVAASTEKIDRARKVVTRLPIDLREYLTDIPIWEK
jgi:hypothetical protein